MMRFLLVFRRGGLIVYKYILELLLDIKIS